MADLEGILESLDKNLNSMSREEFDAEYEHLTHEKFWARWVEKVHSLSDDKIHELVTKCVKKYNHSETELYRLFFTYAFKYGKAYEMIDTEGDDRFYIYKANGYVVEDYYNNYPMPIPESEYPVRMKDMGFKYAMKYYSLLEPVFDFEDLSSIYQSIYSAESEEELFKFLNNGKGFDYKFTERDVNPPERGKYKTEMSYNQAMTDFKKYLPVKISQLQSNFMVKVSEFKRYVHKLAIPCNERRMRLVQEIKFN